jgi:hypothetical protein
MITYDFHPEVRRDLDEIWDFIGVDNPETAELAKLERQALLQVQSETF